MRVLAIVGGTAGGAFVGYWVGLYTGIGADDMGIEAFGRALVGAAIGGLAGCAVTAAVLT